MSYLGSSAAPLPVAFAGMQGQSFNGGTNTFTLSRAVSRTLDIDVVINNVAQNPYDGSYTVNGTTLTTAETVSAGVANVYVIYRDAPIGSFSPIAGSVTAASMSVGAPFWDINGNVGIGTSALGLLGATRLEVAHTASNGILVSRAGNYIAFNGNYSDGNVHSRIATSNPSISLATNGDNARAWVTPNGISLGSAVGANTTGTGISFPATQNASADANTLDDYEEGTWTPVVTGSTSGSAGAYSNQVGRYVKIGSLVTVTGFLTFTKGTILGAVTISLPFTAGTYTGYGDSTAISGTWAWGGDMPKLMLASSGQASAYMWDVNTNTITDVDLSTAANTNNMVFSLTYRAAA